MIIELEAWLGCRARARKLSKDRSLDVDEEDEMNIEPEVGRI